MDYTRSKNRNRVKTFDTSMHSRQPVPCSTTKTRPSKMWLRFGSGSISVVKTNAGRGLDGLGRMVTAHSIVADKTGRTAKGGNTTSHTGSLMSCTVARFQKENSFATNAITGSAATQNISLLELTKTTLTMLFQRSALSSP